jgi:hypothetical protein
MHAAGGELFLIADGVHVVAQAQLPEQTPAALLAQHALVAAVEIEHDRRSQFAKHPGLRLGERDRLRPLELDTVPTRTLQFLVEQRRKLGDEKTRYSNRLIALLKMYFPRCCAGFVLRLSVAAGAWWSPCPRPYMRYEADAAALLRTPLAVVQIRLMLPPALMNNAADARATNAKSKVYSTKSWPCSSLRKFFTLVIVVHPSYWNFGEPAKARVTTDKMNHNGTVLANSRCNIQM